MEWYSARILYQSLVDDDVDEASEGAVLFEEKLLIFSCRERSNVREQLAALAKKNEESYQNAEGNQVTWVLREILEVQEIMAESVGDGTEVFYRYWHNPSERDFDEMRQTQTEAWWKADEDQDEQRAKQQS